MMQVNTPERWVKHFPLPKAHDHKYTRGHLLVVGGALPMSGAARLATHAAQRLCGMVTIACPADALLAYAVSCPAAVLQTYDMPEHLPEIAVQRKCAAVVLGCGAGVSDATKQAALAMLHTELPLVLDADALSVFAGHPSVLFTAIQQRKAPVVLTPHSGEFTRLFGAWEHKAEATLRAANASGAIVLHKGAETIIATPQGQAVLHNNAPPTLAIAGAGDTLAGMIGALLAARMPVYEAACAAAWLHGEMVKPFGLGLMAEDLAGLIPSALNTLATSHRNIL